MIKEIAEWTENVNLQENDKNRQKEIFPISNNNQQDIPYEKRKKMAENEKNKGNEALRSNVILKINTNDKILKHSRF